MARTGRPPKPTEQKINEGTLRPRDKQTPLLVAGRGTPKPSKYLTKEQKARFKALIVELKDSNILDLADRGMLELIAIEEANIIECNKTIAIDGQWIEHTTDRGGTNIKEHPAAVSRRQSVAILRQLYGEVGIGPSSRARLKAVGVDGREPRKSIPGLETAQRLRVVGNG